ncbi:hypothetical protein ACFFU9_07280 [Mariniflexile ostreae]|uniref:Nicotinamide mononucleotide transporter n=1 Tax=Mariniflexile ostreae TaxID=1520892 RepID=A0ABV5FAR0_9FLAO
MKLYDKYLLDFKKDYILYIPLSIILQSCMGSIAAMFITMNHTKPTYFYELILCVTLAMAYNGAVYAQLKMNWIFNLLVITLITDVILIALNVQ